MKTILIVTTDSPHIDRRIYLFSDTLEKQGYNVKILTPFARREIGFEHIKIINLIEDTHINKLTSPIFLKDVLRKNVPVFLFQFIRKIYRRLFSKDGYIQHLSSLTSKAIEIKADYYIAIDLPTLPIVKACIDKNGGIFIYDAHEFFLGQDVLTSVQKKNLEKIETDIFPYIDFLITINKDIRDLFFQKYERKPSEIIYNATQCTYKEKKYLHDLINISREENILLYQGGFIEERNLENLIEMSQYLSHCKLVLLGWGTCEDDLRRLSIKLNVLNTNVFFIPKISQKELIQYSASATIGIIPYDGYDLNTKYCTPNKLFEFICAELPILYQHTLFTVNHIISTNNFGKAINLMEYKATANIIDSLIQNKKELKTFQVNIQENKNNFSWLNEENKLINIFENLNLK